MGRDSKALLILSLLLLGVCTTSLRAQWQKNGTVIYRMVNAQRPPQVVSDGAGGAIIAWTDSRPGGEGIYVQRISTK